MTVADNYSKLPIENNQFLAYHKHKGKKNNIGVVFLGGLMSDMNGTKALGVESFCKKEDIDFIRFDYIGHGSSSGKFTDGTITIWKNNVLSILDNLTKGKQILVGSSLGGWLMLLATLARKEKIAGLVGIASAADFTENLIWDQLNEKQKEELLQKSIYNLESDYDDTPYPITKNLIEDGRKNLLLNDKINIDCPVRLLHGEKDLDVPSKISKDIADKLTSDDIELTLIEDGDHRMSTDENIALLCDKLEELIVKIN